MNEAEDRRNRVFVRSRLKQRPDKGWIVALSEQDDRHGSDGWAFVADGTKTHDLYRTPGVQAGITYERLLEVDGPDAEHPLAPLPGDVQAEPEPVPVPVRSATATASAPEAAAANRK